MSYDPQLTEAENRITNLENSLHELKEVVATNRKALQSIPSRIRTLVPSDLKQQLERVTNIVVKLEFIAEEKETMLLEAKSLIENHRIALEKNEELFNEYKRRPSRIIDVQSPTHHSNVHHQNMAESGIDSNAPQLALPTPENRRRSLTATTNNHETDRILHVSGNHDTNLNSFLKQLKNSEEFRLYLNEIISNRENEKPNQVAFDESKVVELIQANNTQYVSKKEFNILLDTEVNLYPNNIESTTENTSSPEQVFGRNSKVSNNQVKQYDSSLIDQPQAIIDITNKSINESKTLNNRNVKVSNSANVENQLAEKFKTMLNQMLSQIVSTIIGKSNFKIAFAHLENEIQSISNEWTKLDKSRVHTLDEISRSLQGRLTKVENSVMDARDNLTNLEVFAKNNIDELHDVLKSSGPSKFSFDMNSKPWRTDLTKLVENVKNVSDEQTNANQMVTIIFA